MVLDWRDLGGASDDQRFILSEFGQNRSSIGIDLFFGGGLDPFLALKEHGVLEPVRLSAEFREAIPSDIGGVPLYDPDGQWFGTALSSFGILKNERVVADMHLPDVRRWKDLTRPELRGWVGSGDPRNSGSTHLVYESILQACGWEEGWRIIQQMGANIRQFDRSSASAAKACSMGNVAYALVVDFYGFTQMVEVGPGNMSMIFPEGECVLTPDSIAMLKGAPHREVAERFIQFVLSRTGQALWLAPRGSEGGTRHFSIERMAIRPDVYEDWKGKSLVQTNPFKGFVTLRYNERLGSLRWGALNALLGAFVIDVPPVRRARFRIPVSEDELNRVAASAWKNPVQRSQIQLGWQELAAHIPSGR